MRTESGKIPLMIGELNEMSEIATAIRVVSESGYHVAGPSRDTWTGPIVHRLEMLAKTIIIRINENETSIRG